MSSTRYEILIKIGDDKYYLDTFKYDAISLNYDIANIKDISGRNSSYSKTIKLPDSEHNREILGFITNLAVDSTVDANKAIKAWVLVDTIPVFEGNLQLKKLQKNFKTGEFDIEIVIFADNDTLFTTIGEKYLSDLDLSAYNHDWTADNIRFSWTQSTGYPYRYPLIDYGSNWSMSDLNGTSFPGATQGTATQSLTVDEMFPAISRKIVFDKIFQEAGFNYDSEFLNSDYFKNEYIPFNGPRLQALGVDSTFKIGLTAGGQNISTNLDPFIPGNQYGNLIQFSNESSPFFDDDGLWNSTICEYTNTVDSDVNARFQFYINIYNTFFNSNGNVPNVIRIESYKSIDDNTGITSSTWDSGGGQLFDSQGFVGTTQFYSVTNDGQAQYDVNYPDYLQIFVSTEFHLLRRNESVRFRITHDQSFVSQTTSTIQPDSYVEIFYSTDLTPGQTIDANQLLPRKIKQRDFILSACREYNLYIEPSKEYQNTLIIEPRDDYYANGRIKDWTSKLDLNQPIEVDILAETQNKVTVFSHKEDKDYLNQNYKQTFNEIYGQYDFDSGNEFAKSQNKKIESIFSPTPLNLVPGSVALIIPLITKDTLFSYNTDSKGKLDTNIRTLQWGGLVEFNNDFDRINFDGQYVTSSNGNYAYPYAGHLDNPYEPTVDNNFGDPIDVYFPNNGLTTNNLFNRFWYKTMFELTNKDSRILTANFFLTPEDIYNFRFSDKIYIFLDGNGQYYKVNKIFDFDPGTTKTTKVELLRTFDVQVNTFRAKFIGKGKGGIRVPPRVEIGVGKVETGVVDIGNNNTINSDNTLVNGNSNYVDIGNNNTLVNGNNNVIEELNKNTVVIGDMNKVDSLVKNSIIIGDSNKLGTQSQGVYIFGSNNEIVGPTGSTLSNVFVLGDGLTITQSNTNYIGGNTIFSGTVSFNSPNFSLNCLNIEKFNLIDINQTFLSNLGTGFNSDVNTIDVQSDGKVLIGGAFTSFNGNTRNRLVRLNSDGTEDTSFYTNLGTGFSFGNVNHIGIQSDGKILVGGGFLFLNGVARVCLVRLNSDGTVDTSFYTNLGTSFNSTVNELHIQSDGKILVGGQFTSLNGTTRNRFVRLNSNGTVDTSFYTNLGSAFGNNGVNTITIQSDDKILVGGSFTSFNGNTRNRLVRLNSDGTEDTSFYTNLGTGFGSFVNIALEQPDGKILVGGGFFTLDGNSRNNLVRLNNDGTEDIDFFNNYAGSGQINDIKFLSDGGIVLAGNITNYLMRLDSDGIIDSNFMRKLPLGINGTTNTLSILSDDSILVGGLFDTIDTQTANYFAKLSYVDACEYVNGSDFITIGAVDSEIDVLGKQLDITTDSININTDSFQVNSESTILNSTQSFVLSGDNNDITDLVKTGVICLDNIAATQSDTVYLPNVKMYGDAFIQGRLDLTKLGVESILRIIPSGATPSTPLVGDVFYRDGVGLYYWNGSKWVVIGTTPVEFNQLSATQSLTVNNTTSALTNITGWTFSFDANSYYQFEGYIDASITSPASAGPNTQNFIGLCIDFTNSITHYNLTITDIQNLYASTWGAADSVYHIGNSRSSNTINRDAIIRGTTGRMKVEGFVRTSAATTGQFKWTYRNDTTRTFNILSGSVINIIKV